MRTVLFWASKVKIFLGFLTLEDRTDRFSQNIGKELPLLAA
jgi:hypothetical protein